MGEYARFQGENIKIGTCEDMYYLRFQDRARVDPEMASLDPASLTVLQALRFRFPWPDEDHVQPGGREYHANGYARAIAVPGYQGAPDGADHCTVQFVAQAGYLVSLPCPESSGYNVAGLAELRVHRNGFAGAVLLVAHKYVDGVGLVPILKCGGCGSMWREEDPAEIEAMAVAFRSEGDRRERAGQHNGTGAADRVWWDAVADRLLVGIAEWAVAHGWDGVDNNFLHSGDDFTGWTPPSHAAADIAQDARAHHWSPQHEEDDDA